MFRGLRASEYGQHKTHQQQKRLQTPCESKELAASLAVEGKARGVDVHAVHPSPALWFQSTAVALFSSMSL